MDFQLIQLNLKWTPNANMSYQATSAQTHSMVMGTTYAGMPYITSTGSSLYAFLNFLNNNGVLDISTLQNNTYTNGSSTVYTWEDLVGNQCSGSAYWAWSRVTPDLDFTLTAKVIPGKVAGIKKLGNYTIPSTVQSYSNATTGCSTQSICASAGQQTMYAAYALAKKADGMILHTGPGGSGHTQMVFSDAVVVYNGSVIDGTKSYLYLVDQTSSWQTTGRVEEKVTFEWLYSTGYIPFSLEVFHDPSSFKDAEITKLQFSSGTALVEGQNITIAKVMDTLVDCNYPIAYLTVTVKDANGVVLGSANSYRGGMAAQNNDQILIGKYMADQDEAALRALASSASGGTVEITALVGTGETINVFTGKLS